MSKYISSKLDKIGNQILSKFKVGKDKNRCSLFLLLSNFIPRGKALANFYRLTLLIDCSRITTIFAKIELRSFSLNFRWF